MSARDDLGDRVNHMENKMGAHNGLVSAHNHLEDEVASLTAKLADLEDRNRRNNIKLRSIPESVPPELTPFIQQLIKAVLPRTSKHDLIFDRAHRLSKPKSLPESVPRDVIMHIHFFFTLKN